MKSAWLLSVIASVLSINLLQVPAAFCAEPAPATSAHPSLTGAELFSQQVNHPDQIAGVRLLSNLTYVPDSKDAHQTLDLYLPKSDEPSIPLIVWIHGGGWAAGDKRDKGPFGAALSHGFAVASINYRLADKSIFPAQIYDCKAAIRWLRANANQYGLDPNRIGVWGSSAGGHLAALVDTSAGVNKLEGTEGDTAISSEVQAACDWSGPSDFLTMDFQAGPNNKIGLRTQTSPVSTLLGGPVWVRKELAKSASPVTYVKRSAAPILIMHGDSDDVVPVTQSLEFYQLLQRKGVKSEFGLVKGGGHDIMNIDTTAKAIDFFQHYLRNGK